MKQDTPSTGSSEAVPNTRTKQEPSPLTAGNELGDMMPSYMRLSSEEAKVRITPEVEAKAKAFGDRITKAMADKTWDSKKRARWLKRGHVMLAAMR